MSEQKKIHTNREMLLHHSRYINGLLDVLNQYKATHEYELSRSIKLRLRKVGIELKECLEIWRSDYADLIAREDFDQELSNTCPRCRCRFTYQPKSYFCPCEKQSLDGSDE